MFFLGHYAFMNHGTVSNFYKTSCRFCEFYICTFTGTLLTEPDLNVCIFILAIDDVKLHTKICQEVLVSWWRRLCHSLHLVTNCIISLRLFAEYLLSVNDVVSQLKVFAWELWCLKELLEWSILMANFTSLTWREGGGQLVPFPFEIKWCLFILYWAFCQYQKCGEKTLCLQASILPLYS